MKDRYIIVLLMAGMAGWIVGMTGCSTYTPQKKATLTSEYTTCYIERYGQAYDSVPQQVYALDLYSDGLSLSDSTRRIQGTGVNLYLSDLFLPDTLFQPGTYHSDTTGAPYTFLPGRNFEGSPTGLYLLSVADGQLSSILVLDSGSLSVTLTPDSLYDMQFRLYYGTTTYEAHYCGNAEYYDRR